MCPVRDGGWSSAFGSAGSSVRTIHADGGRSSSRCQGWPGGTAGGRSGCVRRLLRSGSPSLAGPVPGWHGSSGCPSAAARCCGCSTRCLTRRRRPHGWSALMSTPCARAASRGLFWSMSRPDGRLICCPIGRRRPWPSGWRSALESRSCAGIELRSSQKVPQLGRLRRSKLLIGGTFGTTSGRPLNGASPITELAYGARRPSHPAWLSPMPPRTALARRGPPATGSPTGLGPTTRPSTRCSPPATAAARSNANSA